jgi:hypothetical protein
MVTWEVASPSMWNFASGDSSASRTCLIVRGRSVWLLKSYSSAVSIRSSLEGASETSYSAAATTAALAALLGVTSEETSRLIATSREATECRWEDELARVQTFGRTSQDERETAVPIVCKLAGCDGNAKGYQGWDIVNISRWGTRKTRCGASFVNCPAPPTTKLPTNLLPSPGRRGLSTAFRRWC